MSKFAAPGALWPQRVPRPADSVSLLIEFLRRFRNPLVLILIAASVVSALTGEVASFRHHHRHGADERHPRFRSGISRRAGRAAAAPVGADPRHACCATAHARDVPVTQVVPGDVALLASGSLVPADGRLLDARDLFVNQALLTGESFPVEKRAEELTDRRPDLRACDERALHGHVGGQRNGPPARLPHRQRHRHRRNRPHAESRSAAHGVRARHAPLRHADHAAHRAHGAVRAHGQYR